MTKIKLSETLKFLTGRLNTITGGELELTLDLGKTAIKPGEELEARATLHCPDKARQIDYVAISIEGQVQRDGEWQDFVKSAEVAQDIVLPADYEFVIPIVLHIPEDAVYTHEGGHWNLKARAVVDTAVDPRAEVSFEVRP
jgi:sporulation-control protein spo0M